LQIGKAVTAHGNVSASPSEATVKIQRIVTNEHKRLFEVHLDDRTLSFPYVRADPRPVRHDRVTSVTVYAQLAHRGFGYVLASGRRGLVHLDQVFAYNEDPRLLRDGILYKLTLEAQRRVATSDLTRRELLRRMGTSPARSIASWIPPMAAKRWTRCSPCSTCWTARSK